MKTVPILLVALSIVSFAQAADVDPLALLKRDLGDSIEVISGQEIRYCPDNTCDIFRIKDSKQADYLPYFVYLYLFHESGYIYLKEPFAGSRPFREVAKAQEPSVRKKVEDFCKKTPKTPGCILEGMQTSLRISVSFGRYDEGKFNE